MSAPGAPPSVLNDGNLPLVQWPAVFAGAVAAAGISFTLLAFGAGIGLSVASSSPTWRDSSPWLWIVSGLWLVLVALCAFGLGGYITGRIRSVVRAPAGVESEFRDGVHGLVTWGLAVLITAIIGLAGTAVLASAVAPSGVTAGPGASPAGEGVIAADVDELLRSARATTSDAAMTYRRAEVSRILLNAGGHNGVSSDDSNYLAHLVSERTGMSDAEAAARTERVIGLAAADLHRARVAAVLQSFMIAAGLLLGAAVAWYSAVEGGRDRQLGRLPLWDWRFGRTRPFTETRP